MKRTSYLNSIISIAIILLLGACQQNQQVQWPSQTNETKPWTRWWWHGSAVNATDLTANLEELKKAGFGGVEITPIYDVKGFEDQSLPFQSEEWIKMLEHTLKESQRLGLGVDLANASGWPFGGPWIRAEHACKNIQHKKFKLKQGEQLNEKIEFIQEPLVRAVNNKVDITEVKFPISSNTNLQKLALDQIRFEKKLPLQTLIAYNENEKIIDLTNKVSAEGNLDWTAPKGNWTLYALFQGWHGKMVERAGTRGEGNVIDHFSEDAIKLFLEDFDKNAKNIDLTGLRAFFNDSYEVDDARGDANWTPHFFEEFEQRRGYKLTNHLPALFGNLEDEINQRVLCDFRETLSELLLDKFTTIWANWAESHNTIIRNQSHGSPANILDLYEASHIPETEGTDPMRIKMASSAGHTSGKPLIACEAATWLNDHFLSNLANVKQNADNYLTHGVNHIVYHGTPYSPIEEKWPGWMFYASVHFAPTNSWWNELKTVNHYIANCQSFLQNAEPDNDILLYFPIYDAWTKRDDKHLPHFGMHSEELTDTLSKSLLKDGYTFDYISDKQIGELSFVNNKIKAKGASYKTIVIPKCDYIPLATLKQLFELANSGATILFESQFPQHISGFFDYQNKEVLAQILINSLTLQKRDNYSIATAGKGTILMGTDINKMLACAKVYNEKLAAFNLGFSRVKRKEGNCYFINNWTDQEIDQWITFNTSGKNAAWFNPMTGKKGKAIINNQVNGVSKVYVQLEPGQSLLLQFYSSKIKLDNYPLWQPAETKTALNQKWQISFIKGGPTLPAAYTSEQLKSWTTQSEELQRFSGTASYKTKFVLPINNETDYLLDLGKVHESAIVILNGKELKTLIGPLFKIVLPSKLLQPENTLELQISNLMANRIIDMDKHGINYKKFYNINFAPNKIENRGSDGNFSAANWKPLPSGLLGPVTLSQITLKKFD